MKGYLYFFSRRILLACDRIYARPHAHYSVSMILSFDESVRVRTKDRLVESGAVILAPGAYHELVSNGRTVVLQLARDLDTFGIISEKLEKENVLEVSIDRNQDLISVFNRLHSENLKCKEAKEAFRLIVKSMTGSDQKLPEMDLRIKESIRRIISSLPDTLPASELSASVSLSVDRFLHLFKEVMGLPYRRYILWSKLHKAADFFRHGESITDAAHHAGFSDSAHLSRTCKEMFGISPSDVFGKRSKLKVLFCEDESDWILPPEKPGDRWS